MRHVMNKTKTVLLLALLLVNVLLAAGYVPFRKSHLRKQRLCSKALSDALYMACRDSGYNEPFSYSDYDETMVDTGPGLVEECCYRDGCDIEVLKQYCKPMPEEKRIDSRNVMRESNVANLPYSTLTRDLSSEQNPPSEMDHVGGAIKRKVDDLKRGRHRGKGGRNDECRGKADAKKRHRGRHCRCRHRRLQCRQASKSSHGNVKPLVNKFATAPPTQNTTSFPVTS